MKGKTLLYVEDDDMVRENFTQILQRYFSTVLVADNGKTALELYETHRPDAALLDISIPHISGLQVAAKIRERDDTTEIIMLTAYADQEKLMQAVNLQLFAYLTKPVQQGQLDITLRNLIKRISKSTPLTLMHGYSWDDDVKGLYYAHKKIRVTNNEQHVLELLCDDPKRRFKACEIAYEIFDEHDDHDIECNNVVQLLSRFKAKMLKQYNSKGHFIQNTYGGGYQILLGST